MANITKNSTFEDLRVSLNDARTQLATANSTSTTSNNQLTAWAGEFSGTISASRIGDGTIRGGMNQAEDIANIESWFAATSGLTDVLVNQLNNLKLIYDPDAPTTPAQWTSGNILDDLQRIHGAAVFGISGNTHWESISELGVYDDYTVPNPNFDPDLDPRRRIDGPAESRPNTISEQISTFITNEASDPSNYPQNTIPNLIADTSLSIDLGGSQADANQISVTPGINNAEWQTLANVTGAIQPQLDGLNSLIDSIGNAEHVGDGSVSNANWNSIAGLTSDLNTQFTNLANVLTSEGAITGNVVRLAAGAISGVTVGNTQFNAIDGLTGNAKTQLNNITALLATAGSLTGTQITVDASKIGDGTVNNTEFNRLNGLTSPIQTQINTADNRIQSFAELYANGVISGISANRIGTGNFSNTRFGYISGLTSPAQTQLNNQNTSLYSIGSVAGNTITVNAASVADGSVSNAEFQRLDGAQSNIQAQINSKIEGDWNVEVYVANNDFSLTPSSYVTRTVGSGASGNYAATGYQDLASKGSDLVSCRVNTRTVRAEYRYVVLKNPEGWSWNPNSVTYPTGLSFESTPMDSWSINSSSQMTRTYDYWLNVENQLNNIISYTQSQYNNREVSPMDLGSLPSHTARLSAVHSPSSEGVYIDSMVTGDHFTSSYEQWSTSGATTLATDADSNVTSVATGNSQPTLPQLVLRANLYAGHYRTRNLRVGTNDNPTVQTLVRARKDVITHSIAHDDNANEWYVSQQLLWYDYQSSSLSTNRFPHRRIFSATAIFTTTGNPDNAHGGSLSSRLLADGRLSQSTVNNMFQGINYFGSGSSSVRIAPLANTIWNTAVRAMTVAGSYLYFAVGPLANGRWALYRKGLSSGNAEAMTIQHHISGATVTDSRWDSMPTSLTTVDNNFIIGIDRFSRMHYFTISGTNARRRITPETTSGFGAITAPTATDINSTTGVLGSNFASGSGGSAANHTLHTRQSAKGIEYVGDTLYVLRDNGIERHAWTGPDFRLNA